MKLVYFIVHTLKQPERNFVCSFTHYNGSLLLVTANFTNEMGIVGNLIDKYTIISQ